MTQFVVTLKDHDKQVKQAMERTFRVMDVGTTRKIDLDMKLPDAKYDSVEVFFWNAESSVPIWISDLKAWSFNN